MSTSISRRSSATAHPTRQQLDELDALLKRMLDLPVNRGEDEAAPAAPPAEVAASAPEPIRGPHRPAASPVGARSGDPAPTGEAPAEYGDGPPVNYTTAEEEETDLKPRVVSDAPPAAAGAKPEDWVPLSDAWKPSARTWKPLSDAWKQAQATVGRPAEPPAAAHEPSLAPDSAPEPAKMPQAPAPAAGPAEAPPPADAPALKALPRLTVRRWSFVGMLAAFNAGFDLCLAPWGAPGRWLRGRRGRLVLGVVGLVCLAAAVGLAAADWFGWTR